MTKLFISAIGIFDRHRLEPWHKRESFFLTNIDFDHITSPRVMSLRQMLQKIAHSCQHHPLVQQVIRQLELSTR